MGHEYDHVVSAWTVGQLRRALERFPDDMPLVGSVPKTGGPGPLSPEEDEDWVVVSVGTRRHITAWDDGRVVEEPNTPLAIELDRPTGSYPIPGADGGEGPEAM